MALITYVPTDYEFANNFMEEKRPVCVIFIRLCVCVCVCVCQSSTNLQHVVVGVAVHIELRPGAVVLAVVQGVGRDGGAAGVTLLPLHLHTPLRG